MSTQCSEIEITPEMIEAGVDAMEREYSEPLVHPVTAARLVSAILRAALVELRQA